MMAKRNFKVLVIFAILSKTIICQAQITSTDDLLNGYELTSLTPRDILVNPDYLRDIWTCSPISTSCYRNEDILLQKAINENVADVIVTYSPAGKEPKWSDIDHEDITPYTWKWIDLELPEEDGSLTKVSLRRPNWWIKQIGADSVGKKVYLNLPELGAEGWATLINIRVNQLDTRLWNWDVQDGHCTRPITGRFEHTSDNIYHLTFANESTPMGVTGNHPIWSEDRNGWVDAADIQIGEQIKTHSGSTQLTYKEKVEGLQTVYNLEVYRDHTYYAASSSILVHNKDPWNIVRGDKSFLNVGKSMRIGENIEINYSSDTYSGILSYYIQEVKLKSSGALRDIVQNLRVLASGKSPGNDVDRQLFSTFRIVFDTSTLSAEELSWFQRLARSNKTYEGMKLHADQYKVELIEHVGPLKE